MVVMRSMRYNMMRTAFSYHPSRSSHHSFIMRRSFSILLILALSNAYSVYAYAEETAPPTPNSYFDMTETRSKDLVPFTKWTGAMKRFDEQKSLPDDACGTLRYHPCVIKDWKKLVVDQKEKSSREQLEAVNSWGNSFPYIVDQLNWGVEDYWETPYEFMEISGDCEDYAIAKYYSLRALGYSDEQLRIIVVQDLNLGGIIHAVLGVYEGGELLLLDNQSTQVLPALSVYHYRPIYGLNETAWWVYYPKLDSIATEVSMEPTPSS
jgi:predicted transglutaminase-like cysteine proteinase